MPYRECARGTLRAFSSRRQQCLIPSALPCPTQRDEHPRAAPQQRLAQALNDWPHRVGPQQPVLRVGPDRYCLSRHRTSHLIRGTRDHNVLDDMVGDRPRRMRWMKRRAIGLAAVARHVIGTSRSPCGARDRMRWMTCRSTSARPCPGQHLGVFHVHLPIIPTRLLILDCGAE